MRSTNQAVTTPILCAVLTLSFVLLPAAPADAAAARPVFDTYTMPFANNNYDTAHTNPQQNWARLRWYQHALLWKSFIEPSIPFTPSNVPAVYQYIECPDSSTFVNDQEANSCVFASDPKWGWDCADVDEADHLDGRLGRDHRRSAAHHAGDHAEASAIRFKVDFLGVS